MGRGDNNGADPSEERVRAAWESVLLTALPGINCRWLLARRRVFFTAGRTMHSSCTTLDDSAPALLSGEGGVLFADAAAVDVERADDDDDGDRAGRGALSSGGAR